MKKCDGCDKPFSWLRVDKNSKSYCSEACSYYDETHPEHKTKESKVNLDYKGDDITQIIQRGRDNKLSDNTIANELNTAGHTTARGKQWTGTYVGKLALQLGFRKRKIRDDREELNLTPKPIIVEKERLKIYDVIESIVTSTMHKTHKEFLTTLAVRELAS